MKKFCKIYVTLLLTAALVLLFTGCKSKTVYVPINETEIVKETARDTIIDVHLVPYKDSIAVQDTTSYLENKYAYSWAYWSNGTLHHSLGIFDKNIQYIIKYIDRDVVRYKEIPIEVPGEPVYINQLNWYQEFCIWFTSATLILVSLYLGFRYRKKIISLFNKLIFCL